MQTKQQGLMEYHLNLLNFLPMLLTILFLRSSKEHPSQTYL